MSTRFLTLYWFDREEGAGDPRLEKFIKAYEQGPQTPEPGAACTNGTGTPVAQ